MMKFINVGDNSILVEKETSGAPISAGLLKGLYPDSEHPRWVLRSVCALSFLDATELRTIANYLDEANDERE
jgi:hypothetical protein